MFLTLYSYMFGFYITQLFKYAVCIDISYYIAGLFDLYVLSCLTWFVFLSSKTFRILSGSLDCIKMDSLLLGLATVSATL